jgi:type VI protein secretion system component Hcp
LRHRNFPKEKIQNVTFRDPSATDWRPGRQCGACADQPQPVLHHSQNGLRWHFQCDRLEYRHDLNWNSTPGTAAKPQISALNLVKELDDASTQLFKLSVTGTSCGGSNGRVVLTQTDPTGGHPAMTITLEDVFVSVYQITGNTGAAAPGETISLVFGRITFEYNRHQSTWDLRTQKAS